MSVHYYRHTDTVHSTAHICAAAHTELVYIVPVMTTGNQWRIQGGRPLRTKIFLISCSFWENPANLYVGAPTRSWRPSYGESCIRP